MYTTILPFACIPDAREDDMMMDVDVPSQDAQNSDMFCPHIDAAFAVEAARVSMLKKYKAAVAWGARTGSRGERSAKRRKVCVKPVAHFLKSLC